MKAAKPKRGRPPVSKKLARGALLSVRFSASERVALTEAADQDGLKLSEWSRRVLLAAAKKAKGSAHSSDQ